MKISPMPATIVPSVDIQGMPQQSKVDSIRTLKMQTNRTPLPNQMQLPIPTHNEQQNIEASVEVTQPLSPQLALIAKQRRALQVKERELANREKAMKTQSPGISAIDVARLKSEPLRVLQENGVTYDQLTEAIMSSQSSSELDALKAEIQSLKQGIDQKFIDKDTQAETQILAEMKREADQLIRSNDEYEFVREQNKVPQVIELIKRTYKDTGEILEVSEALRLFEDELFKDAQKLARLKKMQSQIPMTQMQPQQRQVGMRTLTNRDTAASIPLSAKARAMAAFYGTIKK